MMFRILLLLSCVISALSTAHPLAGNFHVLKQEFIIPGLDRKRTIRVYLPPDYNNLEQRFPVLYMHDAQNLFDEKTSFAGEWRVDESLNSLAQEQDLQLIVVGIDNGGEHRTQELSAWDHEKYGKAEGEQYIDFIVNVLKPTIDDRYRTLPDAANTAIMGSSMGALSSHYAIHTYPQVFSKAGLFSPSYWYADQVFSFTEQNPVPAQHRLYLIAGQEEGEIMVAPFNQMVSSIQQANHPADNLHAQVIPEGKHNEAFWAAHFQHAVQWLFKQP